MPTFEAHYDFLKRYYRHDRFEGMNKEWPNGVRGLTYAQAVTQSAQVSLEKSGICMLDAYDSASGETLSYDRAFNITSVRERGDDE